MEPGGVGRVRNSTAPGEFPGAGAKLWRVMNNKGDEKIK